jgi:hypothetical protein
MVDGARGRGCGTDGSVFNAPWRAVGVTAMVSLGLLAAGCGGSFGSSPSTLAADPHDATLSRAYLEGAGRGLVEIQDLSEHVNRATPAARCRADISPLLTTDADLSTDQVADPILAELLADEEAELGTALPRCAAGHLESETVTKLAAIAEVVRSRMRADGIPQ